METFQVGTSIFFCNTSQVSPGNMEVIIPNNHNK